MYYPHPVLQDMLWGSLHKVGEPLLKGWPFSKLRQKALRTIMQHIHYEDENTQYICIGPVNKVCLKILNKKENTTVHNKYLILFI